MISSSMLSVVAIITSLQISANFLQTSIDFLQTLLSYSVSLQKTCCRLWVSLKSYWILLWKQSFVATPMQQNQSGLILLQCFSQQHGFMLQKSKVFLKQCRAICNFLLTLSMRIITLQEPEKCCKWPVSHLQLI